MRRLTVAITVALAAVCAAADPGARPAAAPRLFADRSGDRTRAVDAVFSKYGAATPGCAVGIAEHGRPTFAKGYGMADLEHDVPITPDTIFEAGSVSKQFTAAAVLLLAHEGKLSLDDRVRKYVPELPDYGKPLLIRHMLTHTSGLRDWGSVAAIAGWPRTSRVHTHAHVLDIVRHQASLNFPPGERFSYSNTGFNLAAIIVARVSGRPFPEFTRERLFTPLGMTHTSWRDDYTRIVKGRAVAYDERRGELHTDMPFENVYGNGGLLTTVGDLLKWNENFTTPVVGGAALVAEQQTEGRFNDGRRIGYALGLYIGAHRGFREVYHSGSTAGYSAFLTRFPEVRTSIALLCNVATNATALAHDVSDIVLAERTKVDDSLPLPSARELSENAGMYKSALTGRALVIGRDPAVMRGRRWTFDQDGATATDQFGSAERYTKVAPASPSAEALEAYAGRYTSADAETEMTAAVEQGRLVLLQRPDRKVTLTPLYADAFDAGTLGTVIYHRDGAGRPIEFSVVQDRVWNMPFVRRK
jgi:CubicO group peptidase (beta-lactamase class C family)